ncbi:importin beta-3 [Thecamonas trahens ATCC 50062]|uniref:Importin beta-3 n=1 Tax=Thecamonas trahens ATCC 50062 TaxID=461836 RepID=A0A0L0DDT4_THETB|nr:importin beta-3 [Thecamonas trahens ATCC 50062]KNC50497.1 importin beta-3 [Thecamonas trahens ATCC 50062]|eukprot:XP_013762390.1 importin beta-3 [Thecamonas trahens ATCC 50062]
MSDVEQFEQLVLQLMSDETEVRTNAESTYRGLQGHPDAWASYTLATMTDSSNPVVRQMCAVLLRRDLFDRPEEQLLWTHLSEQVMTTVQTQLLRAFQEEQVPMVMRAICENIADCFSLHQKQEQEWPELLPFLFPMATHSNPDVRLNTLFVFARMCAVHDSPLRQFAEPLRETFATGLTDSNSFAVRLMGLNATTQFLCSLRDSETETMTYYEPLLPAMLEIVSDGLNSGVEDHAMKAIQFFIDISEFTPKALRPALDHVVNAMLQIATTEKLLHQTRQLALEFLTKICESAPAMMRKFDKFMDNVLPVCLTMMVAVEDSPGWQEHEDEDEFEIGISDFGEQALDRLAVALGGNTVLPVVLEFVPQMLKHNEWTYRRAALIALAAVAEGCREEMTGSLADIVNSCLPYLLEENARVRYAACQLFGQLCIDFTPAFQNTFHEQLVSPLVTVMGDVANPRTRAYGCAALVNLAQGLHPELLTGYLDEIFAALMGMLDNGQTRVQEQALTCVAAIAERSKGAFVTYYEVFVPLLKQILYQANGEDFRAMRGKAMEAISMIGLAVGKELFLNDAIEVMDLMIKIQAQDLPPDDPQTSYFLEAWSRIAQTLGEDFVPYLATIMPPLLETAAIKPEYTLSDADELADVQVGWQTVVLGSTRVQLRTSTLEDKAVACRMLTCLVRDLQGAIWEYVDQIAKLMVPLLTFYFFDDVRTAAADACPFLLMATADYFKRTNSSDGVEYLTGLFEYIITHLLQTIHAEPDLEVLCTFLEALSNSIFALGDNCLDEKMMNNIATLLAILMDDLEKRRGIRNDARNDIDYDEEMETSLEQRAALDELVFRLVVQIASTTFRTHGASFLPIYVEALLPLFMELLDPDRSHTERQWALCAMDDVIEFAWPAAQQYMGDIMGNVIRYATDPHPEVRQAALYGLGAAAAKFGDDFADLMDITLNIVRENCSYPTLVRATTPTPPTTPSPSSPRSSPTSRTIPIPRPLFPTLSSSCPSCTTSSRASLSMTSSAH